MTGAEVAVPTIVKVGGAVITQAAPTGLKLIKSWIRGKEIAIVGQARAGKTTFVDYFQYGLFHIIRLRRMMWKRQHGLT